jgi:penicillin amidase
MRAVFRVLLAGAALLLLLAVGAYLYLLRSLPETQGSLPQRNIKDELTIVRDAHGVPHIFAASAADAYFALGFVHAQDRLWQMEMNRRVAAGRLAEVLGPAALETDRFLRTLGVRRVAQANLRHYDAATRGALEAYASGVNAFLERDPVLPPEFWILGVKPEPWTPADSVAWTKMMAWDLGGNWRSELLRMQLAKRLPVARIQELLPPYPGDAAPPLPELKPLYAATAKTGSDPDFWITAERGWPDGGEGAGSNAWVVSGRRTASGKPLLANDPHLGLTAPAVWYFAHLSAPGLNAVGATLPGVPGILVGRNDRIAWGFANTGPDVQDLYLEKPDARFEVIEETIKVKGAPDQRLRIRVSAHGPVISDAFAPARDAAPEGYALAMRWTALAEDDLTMQSAVALALARDWPTFLAAGRSLQAPQQSVVYADVDGNIGFIAAGRVPVRKRANVLNGLAPAPGWDARYDWDGDVPFDELPQALNPESGAIVVANHKITPPGYTHHLTSEWQLPYRARRIEQLLAERAKHDLASFARIQADTVSPAARELLPLFTRIESEKPEVNDLLKKLKAWDGNMAAERAEPLLFMAWWRAFARALYADELGELFRQNWSPRAQFVTNVLAKRDGQAAWCDDVRTPATETCEQLLAASLEDALADLKKRYGADPAKWRWGEAHAARHRHRPFSRNALLARLFDISLPSPGGFYTVNVGRAEFGDDAEPYANRHAASLRALYDLGDPQASLFIHSGGQSGNPLSPHYRSLSERWARVEYIPMVTDRARIEAGAVQRLVLTPLR